MIESFLYSKTLSQFGYTPTKEQDIVLRNIIRFIVSPYADDMFLLKGFAGTGKSSLIGSLVKVLKGMNQKYFLLAPTGRAAKVFANYADSTATTIHRKIYRQQAMFVNKFSISDNLHKNTVFFVDEASMIANEGGEMNMFGTGCLLDDLIQYVYSGEGCKMILIGDSAQLPPVGQLLSPALDRDFLLGYGLGVIEGSLTEVVRQTHASGILSVASSLRHRIEAGDVTDFPVFGIASFTDVKRISSDELPEMIDACYGKDGIEETLVICRSNKHTNIYNQGIRGRILFKEGEIETGDRLMIARNNYFWKNDPKKDEFIANGDIVELKRIRKITEMYGFHFAEALLWFVDYEMELEAKILLETLHTDSPSLPEAMRESLYQQVYEDYAGLYKTKKEVFKQMRDDPWLNALQVKYAYALTCHKAQGGQWKHVFVDQGFVNESYLGLDYYRWLYTAFTRATENLYFVNFDE